MIQLEICADSLQSALVAQQAGATRIELCDNLTEGGTTPSPGTISLARQNLTIELYVLIRPRPGHFVYSDKEIEIMINDIHFCGKNKCDGVVFGILTPDGNIDKEKNTRLLSIAHQYNMKTTFHRAFDRCKDLPLSLEDVIDLGFDRILTSGGYPTAPQGANMIKNLIVKAGQRIIIMPGSGITEKNIQQLAVNTNMKECHGSFRSMYPFSPTYTNKTINDSPNEFSFWMTNENRVKKALEALKEL